ncbi:regulatory protein zeste-like isoform X2 [Episyrphus balteatus]|uniref:regulatory protein zeste-like isoform X2 n=1 Tax=Episyrphus balteatus TaxID=286459 RepID=UPI002485D236|nr:regulatory protein zeste-like isoform X2 [Episyrphus balteatus]
MPIYWLSIKFKIVNKKRLRKLYTSKLTKDMKSKRPAASSTIPNAPKPCDATVSSSIKCEPELILRTEVSPDTTEIANEYEEIYLERISSDPHSVERLENSAEESPNHQKHPNFTQLENVPLQEHEHATTPSQHQINFDNISAEKLTLNDLLQFKDAQPHEEIIIQIKHPDGRSITIPSSNCINIPHQQITYNQVEGVGESNGSPQIQMYPKIIHANFQQQFNTFATQDLSPTNSTSNSENTTIDIADSFENKINVFKMKEAELRQKEIKLQSEEKRIELYQMEEKLRHKKEMHQLQVEEIKIKLRILCEEEKQLRNIKI